MGKIKLEKSHAEYTHTFVCNLFTNVVVCIHLFYPRSPGCAQHYAQLDIIMILCFIFFFFI